MTSVVYKNTDGKYTVLQCPKCGKIVFNKVFIPKEHRKYNVFRCCECGVELNYLDVVTDRVEIEL